VRSPRLQQNRETETQNKKGSSTNHANDAKTQEQRNQNKKGTQPHLTNDAKTQEKYEEQRLNRLIGTMTNFIQYVENEIRKAPDEVQKKDMQRYVVKMKQLMTAAHNLASQC
jgi:hypothetical protein